MPKPTLSLDMNAVKATTDDTDRWVGNPPSGSGSSLTAVNDVSAALNGLQWAYTGSFALSLWAAHFGVTFRVPGDIDVLVKECAPAVRALVGFERGTKFKIRSFDAPSGKTAKIECLGGGYQIDLIGEDRGYGALEEKSFVQLGNKPVITLKCLYKSLVEYKGRAHADSAFALTLLG